MKTAAGLDAAAQDTGNQERGALARTTKLRNAARANTGKPSQMGFAVNRRNTGLTNSVATAKGGQRYDSQINNHSSGQTNSGAASAMNMNNNSRIAIRHKLPIGFMVQKGMKDGGLIHQLDLSTQNLGLQDGGSSQDQIANN